MDYIEVFMAAAPSGNREAYAKHAKVVGEMMKKYGATQAVDAWANEVPDGELTSMPMAVKAEPGEEVAVGWIRWPSKAARDAGWDKAMADPRMREEGMHMPFDGKRMIFGGFDIVAETT